MIKSYTDPEIQRFAPEWAKTWCTGSRAPLTLQAYRKVRLGFELASKSRRGELTALLVAFPSNCLISATCGVSSCKENHYAAAACVGAAAEPGSGIVGICGGPVACRRSPVDHTAYPAAALTVIGYRDGISSEVMEAIRDGKPYEVVRAMALHPDLAREQRAGMN